MSKRTYEQFLESEYPFCNSFYQNKNHQIKPDCKNISGYCPLECSNQNLKNRTFVDNLKKIKLAYVNISKPKKEDKFRVILNQHEEYRRKCNEEFKKYKEEMNYFN